MLDLLDSLLSPLARLMVALGVPFPDFAERMKAHYIKAARDLADGKETVSRLSVMTGLQRRDISRLQDYQPKPRTANHMARVVALWQSDPLYMDNTGPCPLPKNGPAPSFETLVQEVRRDVHPRSVLDTLEQAGTVALDPDTQTVTLVKSSYQPQAGSEEQLTYLSHNVGDHLAAAEENSRGVQPQFFERAVHYTGLSRDQVDELHQSFETAQMETLKDLNKKAVQMKKDRGGAGGSRFRAGGYFYQCGEVGE